MNARKFDSGWRDSRLPLIHADWGFDLPVSGMSLPMVEYDRGYAVAVINYSRRDQDLPIGRGAAAAYGAFGNLRTPTGGTMPFLTCVYDPRNWAMQLFGHNDEARDLLGTRGWLPVTEMHFGRLLYRLRGRVMPPLERHGVTFSTAPWTGDDAPPATRNGVLQPMDWPGQDMSARRRTYEPEGVGVKYSARNPCTDVDFAVIGDRSGQVELFVDYKVGGAYINPGHKTHRAMSGIRNGNGDVVPSFIAEYDSAGDGWEFQVRCLNDEAASLLTAVTGFSAGTISFLGETEWRHVLEVARLR